MGTDIWNKWWEVREFVNFKCECNENVSVGTCKVKKSWESICSDEIRSNSVREWSKEVNRISAKSGVGLNKLRTYACMHYINRHGVVKLI